MKFTEAIGEAVALCVARNVSVNVWRGTGIYSASFVARTADAAPPFDPSVGVAYVRRAGMCHVTVSLPAGPGGNG